MLSIGTKIVKIGPVLVKLWDPKVNNQIEQKRLGLNSGVPRSRCGTLINYAADIERSHLLTGTLEETNEPYAIAKIAGIKMCESYNRQYGRNYRSVMPTNLYGPNDNFDLETSHVFPALIRRFRTKQPKRS